MKKLFAIVVGIGLLMPLYAQSPATYQYAQRDTMGLFLDIYTPEVPNGYTVVHMFGGGFFTGGRAEAFQADYCRTLAENGYRAVSIDYRLGLRGVKTVGVQNIAAIEHAITIGVEDCCEAVLWLLEHADELSIDSQKIIVEGSSAGAILALQTDYAHANRLVMAERLPDDFRFAAVVAYSGAIFSREGKVKYKYHSPAPTMFIHGTADKIVTYNQIAVGKTGLFGAKPLVKQFDKYNYPYYVLRYRDLGHEVSEFGIRTIQQLNLFVDNWVRLQRPLFVDTTLRDANTPPTAYSAKTAGQLYAPDKRNDVDK
ncbi:MAG: alpha/beta hydrolase fold domain-containing protein [Paludibacter sp.]|nr:alpha/beta hydrolase fold domain-containing protein [Bacteroidales bacterium]MCM1068394.1 alpha/beta hydrolase fold domain-containing protein [Prevotella sp.]MCM1354750.1 alpha/beta hydrolase fold domain-containing protein [Bacteroides sp.]MCM1442159.1 alpha/beta hydrolase fold domain-containing protein [Muribaculum sp.]MCM1482414.1 alpha/beta hydrolase fold domain-containing protein [Paludibacter sp.]